MSTDYNATIVLRVDLVPGTIVLRVKLDEGAFEFEPGQYTVLGLHRSSPRVPEATADRAELQSKPHDFMVRRAYSITSNSKQDELEFVVTLVRSGDLTPRLFNLKEGHRIHVEPRASGVFTMQSSSGNRDLLLIATGSALAPYLSMIRTEFPETQQNQYVVLHAAAVSWDLVFRSQLEELADKSTHLTYLPTITEPERDPNWLGLTGDVASLLRGGDIEDAVGIPIDPDRFDVFLAGSPDMIDAATRELEERGFTAGKPGAPDTTIHVERYW